MREAARQRAEVGGGKKPRLTIALQREPQKKAEGFASL